MSIHDSEGQRPEKLVIGILALQGAFREHAIAFAKLTLPIIVVEVRSKFDIFDSNGVPKIDGIVLPGGESTTMALLAEQNALLEPLQQYISLGNPTWGTCAGMILLSSKISNPKNGGQSGLGILDIRVARNFFGSQLNSFVCPLKVAGIAEKEKLFPAIFIRAPIVTECSYDCQILAELDESTVRKYKSMENTEDLGSDRYIVALRRKHILATAFHPELTDDLRIHNYFARMILESKSSP